MKKINVKGIKVDKNTRCSHYNSPVDIISIKFKCCKQYYACFYCHEEISEHTPQIWNKAEFNTKAVFCGNCNNEITIHGYLNCKNKCPVCNANFNPRCSNHHPLYFEK